MKKLHNWNLSCAQAKGLQSKLRHKVQFVPLEDMPRLAAGIDCAFSPDGRKVFAVAVVLQLPGFDVLEVVSACRPVTMPYIPGLLSFREGPACISAVAGLESSPDVFVVDGHGIAHPRRLGLAAHMGLFFDKPTIGCAKSRLVGTFKEPSRQKGAYTLLRDKKIPAAGSAGIQAQRGYETIGAVVRTRTDVKPVFVSVGNKCTLKDAVRVLLACTSKYRLPEPVRIAHHMVSIVKSSS